VTQRAWSLAGYLSGELAGQGAGNPSAIVPALPGGILPLVLWDARVGVGLNGGAVTTWTDQIRALTLSDNGATTRPAYAADGGNFMSQPVIQFDGVNDTLQNVGFAPLLFVDGTLPLTWFYVCRLRTNIASEQAMWSCVDNPVSETSPIAARQAGTGLLTHWWFPSGITAGNPDPGTVVHMITAAVDVAGVARDTVDGVATGNNLPSTSARGTNAASVYVGNDRLASFATLSIAALGCYATELTAPQLAALRAYYQATWGAP